MTDKEIFLLKQNEIANRNFFLKFLKLLVRKIWLAISLIVLFFLISFFIVRYSIPDYEANSQILIKGVDQKSPLLEDKIFDDLDKMSSFNSLENEIRVLNSRDIVAKVVDTLNLQFSYFIVGKYTGFKKLAVYSDSPYKVEIESSMSDSVVPFSFLIRQVDKNRIQVNCDELGFSKVVGFDHYFLFNNSNVRFKISKNNFSSYSLRTLQVNVNTRNGAINQNLSSLIIEKVDEKNSSILNLRYYSDCPDKSKLFLEALHNVYNNQSIKENSYSVENTDKFINDRLIDLGETLGIIEKNIKDYKKTNDIADLASETNETVFRLGEYEKDYLQANIQLELGQLMKSQLRKITTKDLIPTNLGFEDFAIEKSIIEHNELVLLLLQELKNSNNKNPKVINLEKQISDLRTAINNSVDNLILAKQKQINLASEPLEDRKNRLNKFPEYEQVLRELNRNQKLKEEIFLYLLKKKEENKLSGAIISGKGLWVQKPFANQDPINPNKTKYYGYSLVLSIGIFLIYVYILLYLKNTLDRKEDIINAGLNYIGSITHKESKDYLVVKNGAKNRINEDFRKIRSSLFFSIEDVIKDNNCPLICVTSHSPSEGKSFCSLNLSASFALVGKKVLLIDLDLRSPS